MASADLRQELDCSICRNIYTDPVTLRCGHNFCRVCIDRALDEKGRFQGYSCPECRAVFKKRPALISNKTLCNIIESFQTTCADQEATEVICTYCVDSPLPAAKSCLMCEASLCDKHLKVHSKALEHILCDPTNSFGNRKCSAHKEILKYYCTEDSVCVCVSCCLIGEHRGHNMESLNESFEKKKQKLQNILEKLTTQRKETEERVQRLRERRREDQKKAAGVKETVTALFRDIRSQLEGLEKRIFGEISRQKKYVSLSVSDLIQQLEIKKKELSRRMCEIEEMCNLSDPLNVLQGPGNRNDIEDGLRHEEKVHGDVSVGNVSRTLHTLSDIITGINIYCCVHGPTDILLDANTANGEIHLSDDRKTVSKSEVSPNYQETPEKFQDYPQLMSSMGFCSERHYWDVDVTESEEWRVGMCYPSIARKGDQSLIGENNRSWGLDRSFYDNKLSVMHDCDETLLSDITPCNRVRIYLDYEAGQLSFYSLCDPIRHLHTFSTTFTEPLHAALSLFDGCVMISGVLEGDTYPPRDCCHQMEENMRE